VCVSKSNFRIQRVLIADDDPVSLRFLAAAVSQFGCDAIAVADGAAALAATLDQPFDLLLLDRRMPGFGGAEVLMALRARGDVTPAIATSAEIDPFITAQLRSAGFIDIIEKPVALAALERLLGPHLHFSASTGSATPLGVSTPLLYDDPALAAIGGDMNALRALRGLLAQELEALLTQSAGADPGDSGVAWRERLHRLRASCGFCGATALAEAAARLDCSLRDGAESTQPVLCDFLHLCGTTLSALSNQEPSAMDGARTSPSIPQARKPTPSR
jgi:CheY-like chemotaxis protein